MWVLYKLDMKLHGNYTRKITLGSLCVSLPSSNQQKTERI